MANLTKQSLHLSPGLRSANLVTTGGDMTINSRRMRVNDVELNVVVQGEGPDVLLVHGFPDDHTVWRNQIPALVDAGYRVIALDTRGCGESEIKPREADYAIDNLVTDLVALLDALGIAKVRLVGHDWERCRPGASPWSIRSAWTAALQCPWGIRPLMRA